jgi:hypothetical protein
MMPTPRWTTWQDFPEWGPLHSDKFWETFSPHRYYRFNGLADYNNGNPGRSALTELPTSHPSPMLPFPPIITAFREAINAAGAQAFINSNPNFPRAYGEALYKYLEGRNLPLTRSNLETACQLLDLGTLVPVEEPVQKTFEVHSVVAAPATAEPTPEEAEQLAKLADDKHLNDHQRKVRLEKLAQLARQQRKVFRDHAGVTHV